MGTTVALIIWYTRYTWPPSSRNPTALYEEPTYKKKKNKQSSQTNNYNIRLLHNGYWIWNIFYVCTQMDVVYVGCC